MAIKTDNLINLSGSLSVPVDTVVQGSAKAWVNFNGTGTVAIRASFNVSSITDNGTGDYTVNFTTAMVDANYATQLYAYDVSGNNIIMSRLGYAPSISGIRVGIYNAIPSLSDLPYINVTINR